MGKTWKDQKGMKTSRTAWSVLRNQNSPIDKRVKPCGEGTSVTYSISLSI